MQVMMSTAAWYGDRPLALAFPDDWQVDVHWPTTPEPLTEDGIRAALRSPIGQDDLASLAHGRRRIVILIDDLSRPTPAAAILPHLLAELERGGAPQGSIRAIIATGTHGPSRAGIDRKIGADLAQRLRAEFHDDRRNCVRMGTTTHGSPVFVNRQVAEADLVIGIGGIYPQHTLGFGGGSKIILGVLGRRSIERLHYRHPSVEGRPGVESTFRHDVSEMARMAGLRVSISAMVDAQRRLVWLKSGDPEVYFGEACAQAVRWFAAPPPGDADVVIANAYPMDHSATFVRSKGVVPLTHAAPSASRILIGAASEGIGHHGLFPLVGSRTAAAKHLLRTARHREGADVLRLGIHRLKRALTIGGGGAEAATAPGRRQIVFYPTDAASLPASLGGMRTTPSWEAVLRIIEDEQGSRTDLRAVVYPCSSLQVIGA